MAPFLSWPGSGGGRPAGRPRQGRGPGPCRPTRCRAHRSGGRPGRRVDHAGGVAEPVDRHHHVQQAAVHAVGLHAGLAERPVVRAGGHRERERLGRAGAAAGGVVPDHPAPGPARVEPEPPALVLLDERHPAAAVGAAEVAVEAVHDRGHQLAGRLGPGLVADVEPGGVVVVPVPHQVVPHAGQRVLAALPDHGVEQAVDLVYAVVVHPPPRLVGLAGQGPARRARPGRGRPRPRPGQRDVGVPLGGQVVGPAVLGQQQGRDPLAFGRDGLGRDALAREPAGDLARPVAVDLPELGGLLDGDADQVGGGRAVAGVERVLDGLVGADGQLLPGAGLRVFWPSDSSKCRTGSVMA